MAAFGLASLAVAGCAQRPQQIAAPAKHSKEYFPSSVYGPASRRVIADGQPVPRGGGQYLVGKPYSVAGQTYYPSERKVVQTGNASWYGDAFHGRLTANGEVYDRDSFTAAHPTMPLPSYARVTNLRNRYSMIVRVNDRGPYASNRVMDVSRKVAEALDFKRYGTAPIKLEYVGPASLAGSDDAKLYATLKTDGPARWQGGEPRTLVAEEAPRSRVASVEPYVPARARPRPRFEEPQVATVTTYREVPAARPRDVTPWQKETPRRPAMLAREEIASRPLAQGKWAVEQPAPSRVAKRGRSDEISHATRAIASRARTDSEARQFAERELRHANEVQRPMRSVAATSPSRSLSKERFEVAAIVPPSRPKGLGAGPAPTSHGARIRAAGLRLARSSE